MTRTQAERIAADRNREKGTSAYSVGISYYAGVTSTRDQSGQIIERWRVIQNDHGYERIVAL